jgi:methyl-accepting chemotaxis protein
MPNEPDPHADLYALAAADHVDHEPVPIAGEKSVDEKIADLNKALTKRINDLRRDFDTTRKAISSSVQSLAGDVATLKTLAENNKASIEAQDKVIEGVRTRADAAKKAADDAVAALGTLQDAVDDLSARFAGHTHPVTVDAVTNPPTSKEQQ